MNNRQRILSTVIYADIFDYPLTFREIRYWFPGVLPVKQESLTVIRQLENKHVLKRLQGHYVLGNRTHLPALRKVREEASKEKMRVARRAGKILSRIPTVECVAVTGGVSMNNANPEDDIDMCIIAADHTVWMTRLLSTLIFDIKQMRRKPNDLEVKDKICLNMFWAKNSNPVFSRDWYTAHEIIQMRVLFDRGNALQAFFSQNQWVEKIFPGAWHSRFRIKEKTHVNKTAGDAIFISLCRIFEPIVYVLQLIVMQSRRTTEVITRECIRFHPKDSRPGVSQKFGKRLHEYHVPLAKV